MTGVVLSPLVPWAVLWVLAGLAVALVGVALWRGLAGWWLRGLTACALLAALANPSLQEEDRADLTDIVLLVVDESASQGLADRAAQTAEAVAKVEAEVAGLENTELRVVRFADGAEDAGSLAMTALAEALSEEPRARVAGAILVTDGQVHDMGLAPALPAPLHVLLTGRAADWDRRLVVKNAPAFAILDEEVTLTLRIDDQGAAPGEAEADITIAVDDAAPQTYRVPVGQDLDLPVVLPHGGMNVLQFSTPAAAGELTDRNNAALLKQKDIAKDLGLTFASAAEDAIVGFKGVREVLQGLALDVARIFVRKNITEPLGNAVASMFQGLNLFGGSSGVQLAAGGVMSGAGISAYSGSVVSRPTLFPFAKGIGLMGEAGAEAILPLKRGSDGKLGVASGGSNVVVNIIEDTCPVNTPLASTGFDAQSMTMAGLAVAAAGLVAVVAVRRRQRV